MIRGQGPLQTLTLSPLPPWSHVYTARSWCYPGFSFDMLTVDPCEWLPRDCKQFDRRLLGVWNRLIFRTCLWGLTNDDIWQTVVKYSFTTALWLNWDENTLIIYKKKDNNLEYFLIPSIVLRQIWLHMKIILSMRQKLRVYDFFVCLSAV